MSSVMRHRRRLVGLLLTIAYGTFSTAVLFRPTARAQSSPSSSSTSGCVTERPWTGPALLNFVHRRACARAGLDRDEPIRDVANRARWSALLPRLTVRLGRGTNFAFNSTTTITTTDRTSLDDSVHFELRGTFELDRLGWSPLELDAIRAEAQRADRRRAVEHDVIEVLTVLERDRQQRAVCSGMAPAQVGTNPVSVAPEVIAARLRLEAWTGLEWQRVPRP